MLTASERRSEQEYFPQYKSTESELRPQWGYIGGGTARIINAYLHQSLFAINDHDKEILNGAHEFLATASSGHSLVKPKNKAFPENPLECASAFYATVKALASVPNINIEKDTALDAKLNKYKEAIVSLLDGHKLSKNASRKRQILEELMAFFRGLSYESQRLNYEAFCSGEA